MPNIKLLACIYLSQIEIKMGNEIEKAYASSVMQLIGFFIMLFVIIAFQF